MTVRYLTPRPANQSSRVALFMKLWDAPLTPEQQEQLRQRAPVVQRQSAFGNLNDEGTPYPSRSCLITRFHPDFESVIEPGVKDLMFAIAIDHDLVTYTSCQGHLYASETYPYDERHVGVIPRDPEERQRILALFEEVARDVNARFPDAAIEVAIMDHAVRDGETVYPAIDLYLSARAGRSPAEYFAELDRMSAELVGALLARASQP
jgi:hypothetical protein